MEINGQARIESKALEMFFVPELVYVPASKGFFGGLFDDKGNSIRPSISHRGDDIRLSRQIDSSINIAKLPLVKSAAPHFFMGEINPHFGHFLLESTVRLWPLLYFRSALVGGKYLYCGGNNISKLFERPFIKSIFACFLLKSEDFVAYRRPCRIKNVFIAAPAFEIRLQGNPIFRQLMRYIGDSLVPGLDKTNNINLTPLYLSKSKLVKGISGIINELEIEECLREKGVDILHPETLALQDQIREITSRKYLIGPVGSALHTLLFCPNNKVVSGVVLGEKINSNYIMIDQLCGNTGRYELSKDMGMVRHKNADFGFRRIYAPDPNSVADILLQNIGV